MSARYIKRRRKTWFANIPIPARYRHLHGGKSKIEVSLRTRDQVVAERQAAVMSARLRLRWAAEVDGCSQSVAALQRLAYEEARDEVASGKLKLEEPPLETEQGVLELDPVEAAVSSIVDDVRTEALLRSQPEDTPWRW